MVNMKFCEMTVFFSATPRLFEYQDRDHTMDFKKKKKHQDCKVFKIAKQNETLRNIKHNYKFMRPFTTPYILRMYCTLYLDIKVIINIFIKL